MNKQTYILVAFFGILSLVDSGYGLKCYKCNGKNDDPCTKGGSDLPTTECSVIETRCGTFVFDILGGTNNKVLGTGYQRGCAIENGYCEFVAKGANMLLRSASGGEAGIQQRKCDLCETDYCNSAQKTSVHLSLAIFLIVCCQVLRLF